MSYVVQNPDRPNWTLPVDEGGMEHYHDPADERVIMEQYLV